MFFVFPNKKSPYHSRQMNELAFLSTIKGADTGAYTFFLNALLSAYIAQSEQTLILFPFLS